MMNLQTNLKPKNGSYHIKPAERLQEDSGFPAPCFSLCLAQPVLLLRLRVIPGTANPLKSKLQ